ncbi:hypothetical protein [Bacillus mobilis]|uniref:hypothetical protein n=1 Tax=Bacillus mobilis TaxID=2026190 RepID=UPI0036CCD1E7
MDTNDRLRNILDFAEEGTILTILFTQIRVINLGSSVYFILPSNDEELERFVWIKLDRELVRPLFDEKKELLSKFDSLEEGLFISEKQFFPDIDIEGAIKTFNVHTKQGKIRIKGLEAISLSKSKEEDLWKRGSMFFGAEEGNYLEMNKGLLKRISTALLPYVNTNVFNYLTNKIIQQFQDEEEMEYRIIECLKCKNIDIYHAFEIANEICDEDLCRKCSEPRYQSLLDVAFSDALLVDSFMNLSVLLQQYVYLGVEAPLELIQKVCRFSTLEHQLEIGVTYDFLRNRMKQKFSPKRFQLMISLEGLVFEAKKHEKQFNLLLEDISKMTNWQSLQTTTDTASVYNEIEKELNSRMKEFYFPHPLFDTQGDGYIGNEDILKQKITSIINLYKDTFDLIGDHLFLSNVGSLIKGKEYSLNYVTTDLFGQKLVSKTIQNVKGTEIESLIKETYNSKIRNAIAHPGRFIDPKTSEITIFNKGIVVQKYEWKNFLEIVERLLNLHLELNAVRYRIGMDKDEAFLSTGGILSFQPDFFETEEGEVLPFLIVNQLYEFHRFSPKLSWWAENIYISTISKDDGKGVKFHVEREESFVSPSPKVRECIFGVTPHLEEWIEKVIDIKNVQVVHRYCHYPIDINQGEEELEWIPIDIPVDSLETEQEFFVKSMTKCGTIGIQQELIDDLNSIL